MDGHLILPTLVLVAIVALWAAAWWRSSKEL